MNTYAKPYVKESASTDLRVPVKRRNISNIYFKRNTVEETYSLIMSDLEIASRLLKERNINPCFKRLLCRTSFESYFYLYRGSTRLRFQAADSVLQGNYTLLDYNEFPQVEASPANIIWNA